MKNEGKLFRRFFRRSRAANSAVSCGIPPKFKLTKVVIIVLVTYKNEDPIKNESTRVLANDIFPIVSLWEFFSDAQGQIIP